MPLKIPILRDKGASTPVRFFISQHVGDLRLIFVVGFLLTIAGLYLSHRYLKNDESWVGAITVISGAGLAVLAWAYQTGAARLGVVDLFACEIATLCTVTAVAETAPHLVQMYDNPPSAPFIFPSKEQYSPIFDANSKDLEALEARVVEHVTEFYTYMKAMRDYLRLLSKISQPQAERARWNVLLRNVIYMLFLMLESGRKAIRRLVEFHPERSQYTIVILLSELVAYRKLLEWCEKDSPTPYDARLERLQLRKDEYPGIVRQVYWLTLNSRNQAKGRDLDAWNRAFVLLGELNQRYFEVFGEWIDPDHPGPPSKN